MGGDERQEKEQGWIRSRLTEISPHLHVTFIHPGWGSDWGATVRDALHKSETQDAVVITRFMRTEFGRTLRRGLSIPWHFCWGPGREAMLRSILAAANGKGAV